MGEIIATCGHNVTDEWNNVKNGKAWMSYSIDFNAEKFVKAISYGVLCRKCISQYKSWGIILEDEQSERDWLAGKIEYPNTVSEYV